MEEPKYSSVLQNWEITPSLSALFLGLKKVLKRRSWRNRPAAKFQNALHRLVPSLFFRCLFLLRDLLFAALQEQDTNVSLSLSTNFSLLFRRSREQHNDDKTKREENSCLTDCFLSLTFCGHDIEVANKLSLVVLQGRKTTQNGIKRTHRSELVNREQLVQYGKRHFLKQIISLSFCP